MFRKWWGYAATVTCVPLHHTVKRNAPLTDTDTRNHIDSVKMDSDTLCAKDASACATRNDCEGGHCAEAEGKKAKQVCSKSEGSCIQDPAHVEAEEENAEVDLVSKLLAQHDLALEVPLQQYADTEGSEVLLLRLCFFFCVYACVFLHVQPSYKSEVHV
jgi:hypothetical protein